MIPPPPDAAFDFDVTVAPPAISPDGRTICFGARSQNGRIQLWLRPLDSADARPIEGTEGASFPFWSPDSKSIAFYVASRGRIERVTIASGAPVPVVRAGFVRGASWGKDDTIVYDSQGAIRAIPVAGGGERVVTDQGAPRSPWMLPDGKHLLYWHRETQQIHVVALDGTGDAAVTDATSNAIYANGHVLYMREEALLAQPFDLTKFAVSGAAMPLARGVQQINGEPRGIFSASETGLLVYQDGGSAAQTRLEWFDSEGKRTSSTPVGEVGRAKGVAISPDDRFVVLHITDADGGQSYVRINLSNGARNRLTAASAPDDLSAFSSWSPDGRFLGYAAKRGGKLVLARVDANGGQEEIVTEVNREGIGDNSAPRLTTWSRNALFFAGNVAGSGGAWLAPLTPNYSPAGPQTRISTDKTALNLRLSPDGRWLAYQGSSQTNASVSGVFVQTFPGGGQRQPIADNASLPRWSDDGKSLYFALDNQLVVASATETGGSLHFGTPRPIMPVIIGRGYSYDVTKDGRILALVTSDTRAMRPLTLVQEWMSAGR
jgi:Tol biopolymer transport system component